MTELRASVRQRSSFLALVLVALCLRLSFFLWQGVKVGGDTGGYFRLAENLMSVGSFSLSDAAPYVPSIRRVPVYPFFIMALDPLSGGGPTAIVLAQILLDSLIPVAILLLARPLLPNSYGVAAGAAYAIHPGAIATASTLLSESLFTSLLVASVLLLTCGYVNDRRTLSSMSGVVFGLAALCRPIGLMYGSVAALTLSIGPMRKRRFVHSGLLLAGFLLVVAPWAIRCTMVSGEFVLLQGAAPANWYIPTRWDLDQRDEKILWRKFAESDPYGGRLSSARTPQEILEADRFAWRQAMRNVRADPAAYLISRAQSYPHLFLSSQDRFTGINRSFGALIREGSFSPVAVKLLLLMGFSVLPLLLGSVGLMRSADHIAPLLCSALWVATLIVHVPMWIEYRFWLPVVPFQLVSSAVGFHAVTMGWPERALRSKPPGSMLRP